MLPAEFDVENRLPIWDALSEFFLDTELGENDYQRIASCLQQSPYTSEELEKILYDEVYPVCISNLHSVAGVWTGFDSEWLKESILQHQRTKRWLKCPQWKRWMIREEWERVKVLIASYGSK